MGNRWIPTADRLPDQRGAYGRFVSQQYRSNGMEKTYKEIAREREDEEQEQYLTEWRKKHCTRTKKDTAIRQQAKPSRTQAGFHTM